MGLGKIFNFRKNDKFTKTTLPPGAELLYKQPKKKNLLSISIDNLGFSFYSGTHAQILALQNANNLLVGKKYVMSDYETFAGAGVETLVLTATSVNTFDVRVQSIEFPKDIIEYDIEGSDGTGIKGLITYRKDTVNNLSTYYDWRTILFTRWETALGSGIFTELSDNGFASQDFLTFGANCYNISIGKHTSNNNIIFGDNNYSITFGNSNNSMTFGNDNYSMTFGSDNASMTFGNGNGLMTFGSGNGSMTFGTNNSPMTFGNGNYLMTFGNSNSSMTFGNGNNSMTFGDNIIILEVGNGVDATGLTFGATSIALLQNTAHEKVLYNDATDSFTIRYFDNSALVFVDATT